MIPLYVVPALALSTILAAALGGWMDVWKSQQQRRSAVKAKTAVGTAHFPKEPPFPPTGASPVFG